MSFTVVLANLTRRRTEPNRTKANRTEANRIINKIRLIRRTRTNLTRVVSRILDNFTELKH